VVCGGQWLAQAGDLIAECGVGRVDELAEALLVVDRAGETVGDHGKHQTAFRIGEGLRARHSTMAEHVAAGAAAELDADAETPWEHGVERPVLHPPTMHRPHHFDAAGFEY